MVFDSQSDGPGVTGRRDELGRALLSGAMSLVGLARVALRPAVLGDAVFLDGSPASVEVVYGAAQSAQGSLVRVTTAFIAGERARRRSPHEAAEHLARSLPPVAGSGPLRLDDRPVFLGDKPCRLECQLADGDARWAARFVVANPDNARPSAPRSAEVTVVARDFAPAEVHLAWIGDVRPFLAPDS
jgi:hypothetical protein